jgi:hypothetical protein
MDEIIETSKMYLKGECKNDESFLLNLITCLSARIYSHNELVLLATKLSQLK